jgi:hypothetical protein
MAEEGGSNKMPVVKQVAGTVVVNVVGLRSNAANVDAVVRMLRPS